MIEIKDVIYLISLVASVGTCYWLLVIRVVKLEKENEAINKNVSKLEATSNNDSKKLDTLINSITALSKQIGEHIAYHRGKEDSGNNH